MAKKSKEEVVEVKEEVIVEVVESEIEAPVVEVSEPILVKEEVTIEEEKVLKKFMNVSSSSKTVKDVDGENVKVSSGQAIKHYSNPAPDSFVEIN